MYTMYTNIIQLQSNSNIIID